ncbi:MAG: DUF4402 domain-containing protein [Gammaproteobacteria bacterium]|nr:DUF4402 domain-containing protein [Gammaproteobacteria bacterium]
MNFKKLTGVIAVTAGFSGLAGYTIEAVATDPQIEGTATGSVSSAITVTEDAALNFGSFYISSNADSLDSVVIEANPTGGTDSGPYTVWDDGTEQTTPSDIIIIDATAMAPSQLSIAGAAPDQQLTITWSATSSVTHTAGQDGGVFKFVMGGNNVTDRNYYNPTGFTETNSATDATGALSFNIGAQLYHSHSDTEVYEDGTFEGTYEIMVTY